jgi:dynein heavy chain
MIYMSASEMGWHPFVRSWLQKVFQEDEESVEFHHALFEKYVIPLLEFKRYRCHVPVFQTDMSAVKSLCRLYEILIREPTNGIDLEARQQGREERKEEQKQEQEEDSVYFDLCEKWFAFSVIWTILGDLDEESRIRVDVAFRDIETILPATSTIYDFFLNPKKREFELWETRVPLWRPKDEAMSFHKMIVPTTDSIRNMFIVKSFVFANIPMMIVGETGTGKTVLAQSFLEKELPETHRSLTVNFSAATLPSQVQDVIESVMEKRSKNKLGPLGGKKLVIFIDDFNMPRKTSAESPYQPALELLRFYQDYGGWYDRQKCFWK